MPIKTIDAKTLRHWLDKGEAVLVDVREPAEYAQEHIPGATLVPLAGVCMRTLPGSAGKKLVIHCKAGMRGRTACERLLTESPGLEVYNLEGGISVWVQAGYAVNSKTPP
ncbi:MAG: rhodanese-like domain-containing protein [Pseudomonadota bacterium]|nr:rhodanese-like domain-containing protein [Pseudomonadota bacterium]MDE3037077.1 rhodanese-like domain-containing protein [Pseudomonadota bacterium]